MSMGKYTKPSVVRIVPEGIKGVATVDHFEVSEEASKRTAMRFWRDEYVPTGVYARLTVNGTLMMTDTEMEWRTCAAAVYAANGDVLLGGLGIGMVLAGILQKPEVRSVTVVEKYQDVIDLVEAPLRQNIPEAQKLTIVCADILEWKPPKGQTWDTLYFDIWPNVCEDNLEDMTKLRRRFARRVNRENPKAWVGCWEEGKLRYYKRRDARQARAWL